MDIYIRLETPRSIYINTGGKMQLKPLESVCSCKVSLEHPNQKQLGKGEKIAHASSAKKFSRS